MAPPTPDDIAALAMTIRGQVVLPGTFKYEVQVKKAHNAALHANKPALFICCRDTQDVVRAIQFATLHELPVSVRSGAHSVCGSAMREGSAVIDLDGLAGLEYDESSQVLTIGPGNLLGDVNVALMRHDRMTPVGIAPPTGCGGLILHGGVGWLAHKYGLSVDNVVGLEIVLADGTVKRLDHKSQGEDKEIYFAARGRAGAIGIVTEIQLRTYPMEMMTGGFWCMLDDDNYTETRELAKLARKLIAAQESSGTRRLFGGVYASNMPPDPNLPEDLHHKPISMIVMGVWGDDDSAMVTVQQFADREIVMGKPPAVMPFNVFNQILTPMFLNFPPFATYWSGSLMSDKLTDEGIDALTNLWVGHEPWLNASLVGLEFGGGMRGAQHGAAINKGNDHCMSHLRHYTCGGAPLLYFPNEPHFFDHARILSKKMAAVLQPFVAAKYVNFVSEPEEEKKDAEKEQHVDEETNVTRRLLAIKEKVDPKNVFVRYGIAIK